MDVRETVQSAYDSAQSELVAAEIALVEATAGAQEARASASRLEAAVAALDGVPLLAEAQKDVKTDGKAPYKPDMSPRGEEESIITYLDRTSSVDPNETSEEFDKRRKKRQKAREKERIAENPLGHLKCSGCGTLGSLYQSVVTAPSGAPINMIICEKCGNQAIQ